MEDLYNRHGFAFVRRNAELELPHKIHLIRYVAEIMTDSLKAFMNGLIDYAGLFPPAGLSLDTSINNYARYKEGDDAWMLSRFIIPYSRLEDLEPYRRLFEKGEPFRFSVLGSGTETVDEFNKMSNDLVSACRKFNSGFGEAVKTELIETKLPKEAAFSCDTNLIKDVTDRFAGKLSGGSTLPGRVFYETYFDENWKKDIECALAAISTHNVEFRNEGGYGYAGFKIRCGGVEAEMFPEPEQLSYALDKAREYNVAVKFTAGLHHPVRLYDDSVQTKMFGFFNVVGGALLAYALDLTTDELHNILMEEDPDQFVFDDTSFSWRNHSVSTNEIRKLREVALISFGSCSFDEPREDLRSLDLL